MADELISTAGHAELPESHVRRAPRGAVVVSYAQTIPVVDLADPDRAAVVARIRDACATHGFFQVINHGVPRELTRAMLAVAYDFFRLPADEKAKLYSDDPAKKMRLPTSFNVRRKETTVHSWRDYLRLHCHPLEQQHYVLPDWPDSPPASFRRETMSTYCDEVQKLGLRLYGAVISDSLGQEEGYYDMERTLLGEQEAVNFYPKCPAPELAYGLPLPADPNALSILLMDQQDVAGLQVLRGGKWVTVSGQSTPGGALVVSIGHQLRLRATAVGAAVLPREPNTLPGLVAALDPNGTVSVHALVYCSDGLVLDAERIMAAGQTFTGSPAYALQVRVDESVGAEAGDPIALGAKEESGEEDGHRGGRDNLFTAVLGIMAASSAINAVAAGAITPTPVAAFGFAVLMFAGVSLVMAATVRGGARLG